MEIMMLMSGRTKSRSRRKTRRGISRRKRRQ
jgi:hypothetical protein